MFYLNFSSQFDYLLYFLVSCFNISSLLKYEPNIDFLEFADGSVCEAVPPSNPGSSSLCTEVCRTLVKAQKKESCFLNLAIQSVPSPFLMVTRVHSLGYGLKGETGEGSYSSSWILLDDHLKSTPSNF